MRVPASKGDVFQSADITLLEKRLLMKFLQLFMAGGSVPGVLLSRSLWLSSRVCTCCLGRCGCLCRLLLHFFFSFLRLFLCDSVPGVLLSWGCGCRFLLRRSSFSFLLPSLVVARCYVVSSSCFRLLFMSFIGFPPQQRIGWVDPLPTT
jgi:hypothetical protein